MPAPQQSPRELRAASTAFLNARYTVPPVDEWNIRAHTAGENCDVLIVRTSIEAEDAVIDAFHYGTGAYAIYDGGIQNFYRERTFRGVAYEDKGGHLWTFGDLTRPEVPKLIPCRP